MSFNCIIPPLDNLDLMYLGYGEAMLVLAQHVLKYPHLVEFIKRAKKRGYYIILDNGAAEKEQVSFEELMDALDMIDADEVVIPDELLNAEQTLENLETFGTHIRQIYPEVKIMAVVQGDNEDEWMGCYKTMMKSELVDVIGFSKISIPHVFGKRYDTTEIAVARARLFQYLSEERMLNQPIHSLGMGDPIEFWLYRHWNVFGVRSTDSCYSVLAAQHDIKFNRDGVKRVPSNNEYFHTFIDKEKLPLVLYNIKHLHDLVKEA